MSCLYGTLTAGVTPAERAGGLPGVLPGQPRSCGSTTGTAAIGTVHVRGTNYCNLIVDVDERTNRLRVVSHIDNLMKGQAGNALQNMNLLFGLPETTGLDRAGQYPNPIIASAKSMCARITHGLVPWERKGLPPRCGFAAGALRARRNFLHPRDKPVGMVQIASSAGCSCNSRAKRKT